MKSTDDQGLIPVIVASEADSTYIRTIPTAQAAAGDGSVSLDLGLPPECATAVAAGGKRPEMKDMNGIWNLFSRAIQSLQAYRGVYSASFATAIGGYPEYALVSDSSGNFWVSTADSNTTLPGATGASWQSLFNGYITEAQSDARYLMLASTALQTVTGPVTFSGAVNVPTAAAGTNSTLSASTGFVTTAIAAETTRATTVESNLQSSKVNRSGDTMTGLLTLNAGADSISFSGSNTTGGLRWGGYFNSAITGSAANGNIYLAEIVGSDVYYDMQINYGSSRTDFTFHQNGSIESPKGQVAFQSDLPLPVGMHCQPFTVTIPKGTSCGIGDSPFVASLPQGFSTFSFASGSDTGSTVYTVSVSPESGSRVNIWVASPTNQSGGVTGDVVVTIFAYGYY